MSLHGSLSVLDEIYLNILFFLQQYGWYLVAAILLISYLRSIDWKEYLPKQLLESKADIDRKKQLDQHRRMVRQAQVEALSQNQPLSAAAALIAPEESNPADKKGV